MTHHFEGYAELQTIDFWFTYFLNMCSWLLSGVRQISVFIPKL